jgi:hypothetical protein
MTVQEELDNRRNCRQGLRGVMVAIDDQDKLGLIAIDHTYWQAAHKPLMVALANGHHVCATRLYLRSKWPVQCCPPRRRNEFNSVKGKLYRG